MRTAFAPTTPVPSPRAEVGSGAGAHAGRGGAGPTRPGPRRPAPVELRGDVGARPRVDRMLAGGLRAWLEDGVSAAVADMAADRAPVIVTGRRLAGDAAPQADAPADRVLSGPQVLGALVAVLFRQVVAAGPSGDPLDDALAGLDAEPGGEAVTAFVDALPAGSVEGLMTELRRAASHVAGDWSAVPAGWLPRTNDPVNVALAGGRVVLSGSFDLVLGAPSDGTASVCLVDVCSGARRTGDRVLRHYHALLETLRSGAAPFRVATYYTRDGSMVVEDVDDELLCSTVDLVVAGALSSCRAQPGSAGPTSGDRVHRVGPDWSGAAATSVVDPIVLPRAAALTDALLAPGGPAVGPSCGSELGRRMTEAWRAVPPPPDGDSLRADGYLLRRGGIGDDHTAPFRWTSRAARRSLALAAVASCVSGEHRTPADAVRRTVSKAVDGGGAAAPLPRSLGPWLAGLPAGGRSVVVAEATRWATLVWTGLDWDRLGDGALVGGLDHWWNPPGLRWLGVRGRADVRAVAEGRPVLLCLGAGRPSPFSRAELLLPALVDVVNDPGAPAPARVVGWWPAAGRTMVVPVDEPGLSEVARLLCDRVIETVAATGSVRRR